MPRKKVGPKGQVVIPKQFRDAMGLKPGVEVILEIRGDEIVISKPKIPGSYTEYYTSTQTQKLRKVVDIKEIIEEVAQRDSFKRQRLKCRKTKENPANNRILHQEENN